MEKKQYEEDGEKVDWDYIQKSYQIGEYSKTPTNLLLMPFDFSDDHGGALAMMVNAAFDHGKIKLLPVSDTKHAADQIAKIMGEDKEIGNLIIGSHGSYQKASFKIGGTLYNNSSRILNDKNLSKISNYIGTNSQIILQACHAGSPQNGGTDLLIAMAIKMKASVYGNQSWGVTGSYMFGGFLLGTIPWYQTERNGKTNYAYEERQNAFDQAGKWTKVTYSNGLTKVTTIKNVHYTKSGGIKYDE